MQGIDFDIMESHLAQVVSAAWDGRTCDERVAELVGNAEKSPAVTAARAKLEEARKHVEHLKDRQADLNSRACELNRTLASMSAHLRDRIISGDEITNDSLIAHNANHMLADGSSRALGMIVGELLPAAENEAVGRESEYRYALAAELLAITNRLGAQVVELAAPIADALGIVELNLHESLLIGGLISRRHQIFELATQGRKNFEQTREYLAEKKGK